jgi:hypothetical protein
VRGIGTVAVTLVVASGVLVGSALAVGNSSKPDMTALLPTNTGHIAPIYVDTYTKPGAVLYRFSAVLKNLGGAMDLYMNPSTGAAMQVLWPNGNPTVKPDPNKVPNAPGIVVENRSQQVGAFFIFNPSQGHNHWHFQKAAYYALLLPGGGVRSADKVGFCMWDSWVMDGGGSTKYFPVYYKGVGPTTWCAPKDPKAKFTRMGISRNYGDLYAAQSTDQWVDIKGLKPGNYQIRATANPNGYIDESNPNNNTITVTRTIPGTIADAVSRNVAHNTATTFALTGQVIAPDVPARNNLKVGQGACQDVRKDLGCYLFTSANGPLTFAIGAKPSHGSVTIVNQSGSTANVRYTPQAGFSGTDTFTFTVVDKRKLQSMPATVTVKVA